MISIPISVIVPTSNRGKMLEKCLDALEEQTFEDFEVIVVGSPEDSSEEIVKKYKSELNIRYLRQRGRGPADARNVGIEAAEGNVMAFTDDDCAPDPGWIENILKVINGADGAEGVTYPPDGRALTPFTHHLVSESPGRFPTCNVAYKRDALREVGGFCTKFSIGTLHFREDSDLAFSILEKGGEIRFNENMGVEHLVYPEDFSDFLSKKKLFQLDPLLYKRHPRLYKKYIKFPFEIFTPFYIFLSLVVTIGFLILPKLALAGFIGLILITILELLKRGWKTTISQFFKFLAGQIGGSFLILYFVLKGCRRFEVNPLKLFWVK